MNEDKFWEIVDESRGPRGTHSQSEQKAALKKILSKMEAADVLAFDKIFDQLLVESYTWDLWGAAYIINGGCSDDGFDYFRRGLIAAGRDRYDAAQKDAQSLGDWVEPDELEFEDFKYAVYDIYHEKAGTTDLPDHGLEKPSSPAGEEWSEEGDDLEIRFPRLWEKFGA